MRMIECNIRLVFAPYILHPLLRGLLEWLRIQVRACMADPYRDWRGLVSETDSLLAGDHPDTSFVEIICPSDPENWDTYRFRLVDYDLLQLDTYIQDRANLNDRSDYLDWSLRILNSMIARQELLLKQSTHDLDAGQDPDWTILDQLDAYHWHKLKGDTRSVLSLEFDTPTTGFEWEGMKYGAVMTPLFESFTPNLIIER